MVLVHSLSLVDRLPLESLHPSLFCMHRLLHVSYTKLYIDAVQVQHVQRHVLQMLQHEYPELMYPAALGCLADLHEVLLYILCSFHMCCFPVRRRETS